MSTRHTVDYIQVFNDTDEGHIVRVRRQPDDNLVLWLRVSPRQGVPPDYAPGYAEWVGDVDPLIWIEGRELVYDCPDGVRVVVHEVGE
jgi:hypothetical protein